MRGLLALLFALSVIFAIAEGSDDTNLDDAELGFGLVCGAGAATMFGAGIVFLPDLVKIFASDDFLAGCLSVAAGVMIYVSFVEIFGKSTDAFKDAGEAENDAYLYGTLSFFGGILVNILLGKLTDLISPEDDEEPQAAGAESELEENPVKPGSQVSSVNGSGGGHSSGITEEGLPDGGTEQLAKAMQKKEGGLMKMGLKTALAIGLHNFPEGLATFVGTLDDPSVGASLAIAIAIHNIPEGICVAMPVYKATGSKCTGFFWAFISGISEPIGAGLGWIVLYNTMDDYVYGGLFGAVGGMMVHISIKELLPTALQYDKRGWIVPNCAILGFAIMALSLVLFQY